jgi:transposase InsO family protein
LAVNSAMAAASFARSARARSCRTGRMFGAAAVGVSPATVSRVPARPGLTRLGALKPAAPIIRHERKAPGEMIHSDIKTPGRFERIGHRITGDRAGQSNRRGVGWEYAHVRIDDASRIACSQLLPDEKADSALAFRKAASACYETLGIKLEPVMTDNGSCYKAFAFRDTCKALGLKHQRARPHTPKPTARQSAFQTARREWVYAQAYPRPQNTAPRSCPPGCIATTGIARMVA